MREGLVVRVFPDGIRWSIRDREDDDLLLDALARALDRPSGTTPAPTRRARHVRATAETRFRVRLALDGTGLVRVQTGAGIYDHLLEQLAFHAGFDLALDGVGDLETGPHHTAEDAALALGEALDRALGDRRGIARYGDAVVPMDDALARGAVDLGGRSASEIRLELDPGSRSTCCAASPRRDGSRSTSRRRAATSTTSPRRRSRRSAALCARPSGSRATCSRRRRAAYERRRLRLRRGQRSLGGRCVPASRRRRERDEQPRRHRGRRSRRPAGRGVGSERDGRAT